MYFASKFRCNCYCYGTAIACAIAVLLLDSQCSSRSALIEPIHLTPCVCVLSMRATRLRVTRLGSIGSIGLRVTRLRATRLHGVMGVGVVHIVCGHVRVGWIHWAVLLPGSHAWRKNSIGPMHWKVGRHVMSVVPRVAVCRRRGVWWLRVQHAFCTVVFGAQAVSTLSVRRCRLPCILLRALLLVIKATLRSLSSCVLHL